MHNVSGPVHPLRLIGYLSCVLSLPFGVRVRVRSAGVFLIVVSRSPKAIMRNTSAARVRR